MKKLTIALIGLLIVASLTVAFSPILAVRFNVGGSTVNCYNEGEYFMPEGCAQAKYPTVAQSVSAYMVFFVSGGLIVIGTVDLIRHLKSKRRRSNDS